MDINKAVILSQVWEWSCNTILNLFHFESLFASSITVKKEIVEHWCLASLYLLSKKAIQYQFER